MKIANLCNRIIEFSFYGLFFLVPLVFSGQTSELFEFNKMWLTFGLAVIILTAWIGKMIALKKFFVQTTPLDIPIALFLLSQIVSTIFSLDWYVSLFGYYSRFNGGLLSTIAYILLYYAFLSNFDLKAKAIEVVKKIIGVSLVSGAIVALWGFPSHFGYDPTCFIFRGSLDVSCWTEDFLPKVRIFSTLGQPAWLGAYLALLIPIAIASFFQKAQRGEQKNSENQNTRNSDNLTYRVFWKWMPLVFSVLFYVDLLFTRSRAALLGAWIALGVFVAFYFWNELKGRFERLNKKFIIHHLSLIILLLAFIASTLVFYYPSNKSSSKAEQQGTFSSGGGGTESGQIRLLVWKGALDIFARYPLIGSGVETFAFSYYKHRPVEHNLTSEWNYLYNKAHNEYLNFLATTGAFGLGTYLFIIGTFLYLTVRKLFRVGQPSNKLLITGLLAGYVSILITNFFGFSVVIISLYFFLIPAFIFVLSGSLNEKKAIVREFGKSEKDLSLFQKLDILVLLAASLYLLSLLLNFYLADRDFALGANLQNAGSYDKAYLSLENAVARAPFEPTFKDALAQNNAILGVSILSQLTKDQESSKEAELAQNLVREAIVAVNEVTSDHPNNVTYWKTKVRVFYTLSQIDPRYTELALSAIKKTQSLAPTDANVSYNLALLEGQTGDTKAAVETLKKTVKLKPNYINAHYALGLFYRQLATDKNGNVVDESLEQKAIGEMQYILKNIDPNNQAAKDALELWSGAE